MEDSASHVWLPFWAREKIENKWQDMRMSHSKSLGLHHLCHRNWRVVLLQWPKAVGSKWVHSWNDWCFDEICRDRILWHFCLVLPYEFWTGCLMPCPTKKKHGSRSEIPKVDTARHSDIVAKIFTQRNAQAKMKVVEIGWNRLNFGVGVVWGTSLSQPNTTGFTKNCSLEGLEGSETGLASPSFVSA